MGPDQNTDKNTDQENNTDNNIDQEKNTDKNTDQDHNTDQNTDNNRDQEKNTDKNTDQEKNTDNNTDQEKNTDQNTDNNRDQEKNTDNNTDQDHNTDQNTDNNRDQEKNTDKTVCVTGAGGFIASWLVKMLLAKGYTVRGAVHTDPADDGLKYKHLTELEGAKERLELMKADILDHQDLVTVIQGCHGVFHTACLLSNDPERVMEPAVNGTRNVMEVCAEMGVKRVVVTSSIGAVYMDPRRDPLAIVDDDCWSDLDHCIETKNWYCYAKILAEKLAWEIAEKRNLEVAVICPCVVLGPLLQPKMNASTAHIMKYLTGSAKTYKNLTQAYVDVRDVAEAHILVYEAPSARGQRYLCAESNLHRGDLVNMLAELCPQYPLPTKCSDEENPRKEPYKFSNQKLRDLGLSFTPIKECLADTVANLQQKSFLP